MDASLLTLPTIGSGQTFLDLTSVSLGYKTYPDTVAGCKYSLNTDPIADIYASLGNSVPWVYDFADTQCQQAEM